MRKGLSPIELLITAVGIGALTTAAMVKFSGTKDEEAIASMKLDLRRYMEAQSSHFSAYDRYASATRASGAPDPATLVFAPTAGNALGTPSTTVNGFHVTIRSASLATARTCGIYVGTATPQGMPARVNEGEAACW